MQAYVHTNKHTRLDKVTVKQYSVNVNPYNGMKLTVNMRILQLQLDRYGIVKADANFEIWGFKKKKSDYNLSADINFLTATHNKDLENKLYNRYCVRVIFDSDSHQICHNY